MRLPLAASCNVGKVVLSVLVLLLLGCVCPVCNPKAEEDVAPSCCAGAVPHLLKPAGAGTRGSRGRTNSHGNGSISAPRYVRSFVYYYSTNLLKTVRDSAGNVYEASYCETIVLCVVVVVVVGSWSS